MFNKRIQPSKATHIYAHTFWWCNVGKQEYRTVRHPGFEVREVLVNLSCDSMHEDYQRKGRRRRWRGASYSRVQSYNGPVRVSTVNPENRLKWTFVYSCVGVVKRTTTLRITIRKRSTKSIRNSRRSKENGKDCQHDNTYHRLRWNASVPIISEDKRESNTYETW